MAVQSKPQGKSEAANKEPGEFKTVKAGGPIHDPLRDIASAVAASDPPASPPDNLASAAPADDSSPPQDGVIVEPTWEDVHAKMAEDGIISPRDFFRSMAEFEAKEKSAPISKGDPDPPNGPPGWTAPDLPPGWPPADIGNFPVAEPPIQGMVEFDGHIHTFGQGDPNIIGVTIPVTAYRHMLAANKNATSECATYKGTLDRVCAERNDLAAELATLRAIDPSERLEMNDLQWDGYQVVLKACAAARVSSHSGNQNTAMAAFLDLIAARAMKK